MLIETHPPQRKVGSSLRRFKQRRDLKIGEILADAIANSPYREIRKLRVKVLGENLVITGDVSCYYMKQIAQETIKKLTRSLSIRNDVVVNATDTAP